LKRTSNGGPAASTATATPYGEVIILFPDAFESEEQLVRTLAHERIHVAQARIYGPPRDSVDAAARERAALESEESWWRFYRDKH
jgi:hypothetical protein